GAVLLLGAPAAHAQDAAPAPPPAERSVHDIDPWQKMNRGFFRIHNFLDRLFIRPAAMVYRALTPGPIGKAAHNFLTNIQEPAILANDLLQLRFKRAGETSIRLVGNTLAGVGGLIDVAGKAGIPFHDNGFAITMGRYGIGPGPYLFVPLMGPSSVRDAIGTAVDFTLDPIKLVNYPRRAEVSAGLTVLSGLDLRSRSDVDLEALFADATDPYATLRSTYLQNQQAQVDGRDNPGDTLPEFETIPSEQNAPAGGDQAVPQESEQPAPPSQASPSQAPKADAPPPGAVSGLDLRSLPHQAVTIDAGLAGEDRQPAAVELVSAPAQQPLMPQPLILARAETPAWR
ncbi:MAG TPA: MlaA family lipoprotein, partial [Caulobacteraceae bacterium]